MKIRFSESALKSLKVNTLAIAVPEGGVGKVKALKAVDQELAGDLRAAAMDDHRAHAHLLQQDDIGGEGGNQIGIDHGMAAVLDDDGLVEEAPDVGQRLDQDLCLVDELFHRASWWETDRRA